VTNDMRIAREEIFGPVLVIIPFKDEADAIRIVSLTIVTMVSQKESGPKICLERIVSPQPSRQVRSMSTNIWLAESRRHLAVAKIVATGVRN